MLEVSNYIRRANSSMIRLREPLADYVLRAVSSPKSSVHLGGTEITSVK